MQRLLFEDFVTEISVWQERYIDVTDRGTFGRNAIHIRCDIFHTVATLRFVAGLKPKETHPFDTTASGLNLRVTPNGVKAWSIMFTSSKDDKEGLLSAPIGRGW
jgi:hypothetical protein